MKTELDDFFATALQIKLM